jgi:hypothetical protein
MHVCKVCYMYVCIHQHTLRTYTPYVDPLKILNVHFHNFKCPIFNLQGYIRVPQAAHTHGLRTDRGRFLHSTHVISTASTWLCMWYVHSLRCLWLIDHEFFSLVQLVWIKYFFSRIPFASFLAKLLSTPPLRTSSALFGTSNFLAFHSTSLRFLVVIRNISSESFPFFSEISSCKTTSSNSAIKRKNSLSYGVLKHLTSHRDRDRDRDQDTYECLPNLQWSKWSKETQ